MTSGWAGISGEYYLTVVSQQQRYNISSTIYYPLWSIWRIQTSTLKAYLHHEQLNSASRYGSTSTKVRDAGVFYVDKQKIYVISIADGYNPYYNYYTDNLVSPCSTGFFSNSGTC